VLSEAMTRPLRALASLIVGLTTAVGMVVYQRYSREPPSSAFTVAVTMGASILAWLVTALE
jgi:ABC-type Fe3+-siderophore transport system permease subunit